jgi:hypothetical protein
LAEGREQGRAIRRYLEAREAYKPKRGRKRTPESIKRQLTSIEKRVQDADPLTALQLRQQRMDLERELSASTRKIDLKALEEAFVAAAGAYSRRKGITYAAWREVGVPPDVLKRAGLKRGNG